MDISRSAHSKQADIGKPDLMRRFQNAGNRREDTIMPIAKDSSTALRTWLTTENHL
ncbi:MAG: hypothetical protein ACLSX5_03650 [Lachnospiraceae bacterium]